MLHFVVSSILFESRMKLLTNLNIKYKAEIPAKIKKEEKQM